MCAIYQYFLGAALNDVDKNLSAGQQRHVTAVGGGVEGASHQRLGLRLRETRVVACNAYKYVLTRYATAPAD